MLADLAPVRREIRSRENRWYDVRLRPYRTVDERLTAAVLDIRLGRETVAPVARRLAERGIPFVFYTGQEGDPILAEWPDCKIVSKPALPGTIVAAVAGSLK